MLIHKKPKPVAHDLRVNKIFALWPRKINPNTSAWLQYVYRVDKFWGGFWEGHSGYFITEKEALSYIEKHKPHKEKGFGTIQRY